jgi:hypothetical protein
MPTTFTKIAAVTVGSGGAASIDFTSIPSTYTDLVVKASLRHATGSPFMAISFNGSSANFTYRYLEGNGASASSSSGSTNYCVALNPFNATASTFSNSELYIPNYAGSSNKSFSADGVTENNATTAYADMFANLWSNTAAINQITIAASGGFNLVQYSTATLYGIKNS